METSKARDKVVTADRRIGFDNLPETYLTEQPRPKPRDGWIYVGDTLTQDKEIYQKQKQPGGQ